jgi:uncharacterized membrane protein YkvA (DUF1232 family)
LKKCWTKVKRAWTWTVQQFQRIQAWWNKQSPTTKKRYKDATQAASVLLFKGKKTQGAINIALGLVAG